MQPRARLRLLTSLLGLVVVLAGVYYWPREKPPNLLLVTVDTLRADRLGFAGHARPLSPTLDRLAAEGVAFDRSYSVSGWTLPAMATLLTGRYPREHGATDFHLPVRDSLATLASILLERGYDTRGYVSQLILTPHNGFARGFDLFDDTILDRVDPLSQETSRPLTSRVIEQASTLSEPFFLWVHYYDPHFTYLEHEPWRAFGSADLDRYDQEIAHTDAQIGRLLAFLEDEGLDERTVVAVTSDHGEEFGEHGGQYHYTLFGEVVRVPLVIRAPGLEPGRRSLPVEQVDIFPTLLGLLGIEVPQSEAFPGWDLFSPAATGSDEAQRAVFLERDRPPPYRQRAVILGRHKLLRVERREDLSDVPAEGLATFSEVNNVEPGLFLYDLEDDPAETRNLYRDDDPIAQSLLALLEEHFANAPSPATGEVPLSDELRQKLRSLGYLQ